MKNPAKWYVAARSGNKIKADGVDRSDGHRVTALRTTRALGAIALLVVGAVHLEQYTVAHFSVIPTIGRLFLLNFIAATILGLLLLAPVRGTSRPHRLVIDSLAALAGMGVAAGALAALLISEQTPLFGFMEYGYRAEIVIAIAAEAVALVALGAFLAYARRRIGDLRFAAGPPGGAIGPAKARTATET